MTNSFESLPDEEKLLLAIAYVSCEVTLPLKLKDFLTEQGIYDVVLNPLGKKYAKKIVHNTDTTSELRVR